MPRTSKLTGYYVTALLAGGTAAQQTAWLAGPFLTHRAARAMVPAIRHLARKHDDPRFQFAAYGAAKLTVTADKELPAGRLDVAALIDDVYISLVIDPWPGLKR